MRWLRCNALNSHSGGTWFDSRYRLIRLGFSVFFFFNLLRYVTRPQIKFPGGRLQKQTNLMERFIGSHTPSVELFSYIFTSGIETFVIPWDPLLYPCVVEVCRLELEPLWHSSLPLCYSDNPDAHRTGISWGVRKDGNQWARDPDCRMDDD